MSVLSKSKVLVLNKGWRPIRVYTLEKAMTKICSTYKNGEPKAKIIDCINGFQSLTWADWSTMKPNTDYCPNCHKIMDKNQNIDGHCAVCNNVLGETGIRSVSAILRIPRVIQLMKYDKMPQHQIKYNRRTIFQRDEGRCQYCNCKPKHDDMSVDHVMPRCKGGKTEWTNIVVACTACNSKKGSKTLEEAGMKLLKKPIKPKTNIDFGDVIIKDWQSFLDEVYWHIILENDNK